MTSRRFILFPSLAGTWRIATDDPDSTSTDVPIPADFSADAVGASVAAAMNANGYDGRGVLLAIPSAWCLCAAVITAGLPGRNLRQALAYRLEEKLPVAAEDVVADFISIDPTDNQTFSVGAQTATLAPLVDALEAHGIAIAAICPAALLALQHLFQTTSIEATDGIEAVILQADAPNHLELFILRGRRLHGWSILADDAKDLLVHLRMELHGQEMSDGASKVVAALNVRPEILAALSKLPQLRLVDIPMSPPHIAAASMAGGILAGKVAPWIDLRRDALAVREPFRQVRTPLNFAAGAIFVGVLCLCAAMLCGASRYDRLAENFADEQQAVYRKAFPGSAVPGDVRSRLAAEEKSLRAVSGDTSGAPLAKNGLVTLRDLLTHLPADADLRYRVLELRLDQSRFTLEGQAAAHGDADLIAAALRHGGLFNVEPPRTEQLGNADASADADPKSAAARGVSFTISGSAAAESALSRERAK